LPPGTLLTCARAPYCRCCSSRASPLHFVATRYPRQTRFVVAVGAWYGTASFRNPTTANHHLRESNQTTFLVATSPFTLCHHHHHHLVVSAPQTRAADV